MVWVLLALIIAQTLLQKTATTMSFTKHDELEEKKIFTTSITLAEKENNLYNEGSSIPISTFHQETHKEYENFSTTSSLAKVENLEGIHTTTVSLVEEETPSEKELLTSTTSLARSTTREKPDNEEINVTTTISLQEYGTITANYGNYSVENEKTNSSGTTMSLSEQHKLWYEEMQKEREQAELEKAKQEELEVIKDATKANAEPCVYVNTMFKTEERGLEAATPTDCEKLCRTMNPNSAEDGVRCLSWNMDKLQESCKVNVTIPTEEPNTYYGITNCTKPGSPSGNAATCTMLNGKGSILDGNAMIWGPEEKYTLCNARCDSNKNCLAWQFIASKAWTSCRFYEWKGSPLADYSGAPWWCGIFWGTTCGPNCCSSGDCCEGPNVCASGESCQELKCQHEGGQVCGGNCCTGNTPMCCTNADGLNVCVESDASCQQYNCQSKGGLTCGKQCCSANSTCCTGLNTETCVKTLTDCVALECLEEGGIACGDSCCGGGTFCCNGKCMTDLKDCLAEQCLQVEGQFCGKSCCRQQTTTPFCCSDSQTCVQDGSECRQLGCGNWCHNAGECCQNPFYVCCKEESLAVCAANPLFCRNDLAEFAVGFVQKKTN